MKIFEELKKRRKERRLSQEQTAQLAGVSLNVIRAIESGKESVQMDSVSKVLKLFGLELVTRAIGQNK